MKPTNTDKLKAAQKELRKLKKELEEVCNRCGAKYYDTLGIGSCPKCFYGLK